MLKQFTPCPACGAVGEVNSVCQFCGTTIIFKEGAISSNSRIVESRTVTPQQYAEKIAIYHNVVGLGNDISKVSIGEQEGIINLNGDLIYPLGNERISVGYDDNVKIGDKYFNLKTFEFVKDPYLDSIVLTKIRTLSEAITNNPTEEGVIQFGDVDGNYDILLEICNASWCYDNNTPGWIPQLAIRFMNVNMDNRKFSQIFKRFTSCDEFKFFEIGENEESLPIQERAYHAFFGDNAEECCRTILRILHNIYEIRPENASNNIYCGGGIFDGNQTNLNPNKGSNSTGGGCLGMFVLLLSVGGAGIYGLTQLIGNLIA